MGSAGGAEIYYSQGSEFWKLGGGGNSLPLELPTDQGELNERRARL
jgi:hypothetical protein